MQESATLAVSVIVRPSLFVIALIVPDVADNPTHNAIPTTGPIVPAETAIVTAVAATVSTIFVVDIIFFRV